MSYWIELHQAVWTHRKTLKVAATLKVPAVQVVGHLASMWSWGLDNVPMSGEVDPDFLALAAGWQQDGDAFTDALRVAGYLDCDAGGTWRIHDWDQYAGRLLKKRETDAERKRVARAEASNGCPVDKDRTSVTVRPDGAGTGPTGPDRTGPNQPDQTRPTGDAPVAKRSGQTARQRLYEQRVRECITEDWRDGMVAHYQGRLSEEVVRREIAVSLDHENAWKWLQTETSLPSYVKNWLDRRVREVAEGGRNGHARVGAGRATGQGGSGESVLDPDVAAALARFN